MMAALLLASVAANVLLVLRLLAARRQRNGARRQLQTLAEHIGQCDPAFPVMRLAECLPELPGGEDLPPLRIPPLVEAPDAATSAADAQLLARLAQWSGHAALAGSALPEAAAVLQGNVADGVLASLRPGLPQCRLIVLGTQLPADTLRALSHTAHAALMPGGLLLWHCRNTPDLYSQQASAVLRELGREWPLARLHGSSFVVLRGGADAPLRP